MEKEEAYSPIKSKGGDIDAFLVLVSSGLKPETKALTRDDDYNPLSPAC